MDSGSNGGNASSRRSTKRVGNSLASPPHHPLLGTCIVNCNECCKGNFLMGGIRKSAVTCRRGNRIALTNGQRFFRGLHTSIFPVYPLLAVFSPTSRHEAAGTFVPSVVPVAAEGTGRALSRSAISLAISALT